MTTTTITPRRVLHRPPRSERAMERLTWMILGVSSVLSVVAAIALGVLAVRTLAYVTVPARVEQVSGVVLLRQGDSPAESALSRGAEVFPGDRLQVTPGATASLRLFDGSMLTLFPTARVRVEETRAPRAPSLRAEAGLAVEEGTVRVSVPAGEPERRSVWVETPGGIAQLTPGQFTVRAAERESRISVWEGKATLLIDSQVVDVPAGRKIVLRGGAAFALGDVLENVLANGSFADRFERWGFWEQEEPRADTKGQRQIVVPAEPEAPGLALRFFRQSPAQTHNETGVTQFLNRDVSGARSIVLDLWLKVDYASLSGGGYVGTEYPAMLRVNYYDLRGGRHTWTKGFYYANPEQRPTTNGELVRQSTWTHFRADLAQLVPTPYLIEDIIVLAAGHSYDSSVADIKLLVD